MSKLLASHKTFDRTRVQSKDALVLQETGLTSLSCVLVTKRYCRLRKLHWRLTKFEDWPQRLWALLACREDMLRTRLIGSQVMKWDSSLQLFTYLYMILKEVTSLDTSALFVCACSAVVANICRHCSNFLRLGRFLCLLMLKAFVLLHAIILLLLLLLVQIDSTARNYSNVLLWSDSFWDLSVFTTFLNRGLVTFADRTENLALVDLRYADLG